MTVSILQIHAPMVWPSAPPLFMTQCAGLFRESGLAVEQVDANLDFYRHQTCGGAVSAADVFRSQDFFNPTRLDHITNRLKKQFEVFVEGCKTSFRAGADPKEKLNLDRSDLSLYADFCEQGLKKTLSGLFPVWILVHAASTTQQQAGVAIAGFCRRLFPAAHLTLACGGETVENDKGYWDSRVTSGDWVSLAELAGRLTGVVPQPKAVLPDFHGLDLKGYWLPEPVLPFSILEPAAGSRLAPERAAVRLCQMAETYDVRLFFCPIDVIPLSYAADLDRALAAADRALNLAIRCLLEPAAEEPPLPESGHIRLIQWELPQGSVVLDMKTLIRAYRAGIWNHLVFPEGDIADPDVEICRTAAAGPNIVHAFLTQGQACPRFCPMGDRAVSLRTPYDQIRCLPGRPVWQFLQDTLQLLQYVRHHGLQKTTRMRLIPEAGRAYTLGENLEYFFVKPEDLPSGYLDQICQMVEAGGSVGSQWVRYNLERAFLIAYVTEAGVIVGNSSLKHPRTEYIQAVSRQAHVDLSEYLERGYTSVRSEYRGMGIGTRLLEGLTKRAGERKIFSIISEDNHATQKIAIRNRTRQIARFYSERMGKELGVWMPEWMIDDDPQDPDKS